MAISWGLVARTRTSQAKNSLLQKKKKSNPGGTSSSRCASQSVLARSLWLMKEGGGTVWAKKAKIRRGAADFNPPQWPCVVGYQLLYSNQMRLVSLIRTVSQSYYMQFGVTKLSFHNRPSSEHFTDSDWPFFPEKFRIITEENIDKLKKFQHELTVLDSVFFLRG